MKERILYIFAGFILLGSFTSAQNKNLDSLLRVVSTAPNDTVKVNNLITICDIYSAANNIPLALEYSKKANDLGNKLNFSRGILRSLQRRAIAFAKTGNFEEAAKELDKGKIHFVGGKFRRLESDFVLRKANFKFRTGKLDSAIVDFARADSLFERDGDTLSRIECKRFTAQVYQALSEYEKAISFCNASIDLGEKLNNPRYLFDSYVVLGNIFQQQRNYVKARQSYEKALGYAEQLKNPVLIAGSYMTLGNTYIFDKKLKDHLGKAKENYLKCLKIREELGDELGVAYILTNIAGVELESGNYDIAGEYYRRGLVLAEKFNDRALMLESLHNLSGVEYNRKKFKEAELYALRALQLVRKTANKELEFKIKKVLGGIYFEQGKYKEAYQYKDSATILNDLIYNEQQAKVSLEMEEKYENQKKENEIKLQKLDLQMKDSEIETNKKQRTIIIGVLILVVIFLLILFNRFKVTNKQKSIITVQKAEVEKQKHELQEKQKEILDSITYAKRLQSAILIPEASLNRSFSECFVLYLPKDIVSGDFYWFAESPQNKIIAVADCTGHGVPGGFMCMMGNEMLSDILLKEHITTTSEALKAMDLRMTTSLNRSEGGFRDGMDIALCAFSKKSNELQFSGANRPLLHVSDGKLMEYSPDKNTIGGDIDGQNKQYTSHTITYKKGDIFYLFTDGYADQFGGADGKKLRYKKLKEIIEEIHHEPLNVQKQKLHDFYMAWKGQLEQIDDVCIVGIRI